MKQLEFEFDVDVYCPDWEEDYNSQELHDEPFDGGW